MERREPLAEPPGLLWALKEMLCCRAAAEEEGTARVEEVEAFWKASSASEGSAGEWWWERPVFPTGRQKIVNVKSFENVGGEGGGYGSRMLGRKKEEVFRNVQISQLYDEILLLFLSRKSSASAIPQPIR